MKSLTYLFVVLAVVIVLTLLALEDTGYVLISRAPVEIEISLALFVLVLFLAFVALHLTLRFVNRMYTAPRDIGKWQAQKRTERAQTATMKGYAGLIEGDWQKAEKQLTRDLERSPTPLLNYLGASYAAQQQGDVARRDAYLQDAQAADPRSRVAVQLTQARMQYQNGQYNEALTTLQQLYAVAPRNSSVVRLLTDVARHLGDWNRVTSLLPAARRTGAYTDQELSQHEGDAVHEVLSGAAHGEGGAVALQQAWQGLSRSQRKDARLIEIYARQLIDTGDMDRAEKILRATLKRNWQRPLVNLYGLVNSSRPAEQFKVAEAWAKLHPAEPELMLTLGRLAVLNKLWGKAASYFETAIAEGDNDEAYAALGELLEQLGEHDRAREIYRRGLQQHGSGAATRLPKPLPDSNDEPQPLDGIIKPAPGES